MPSFIGTGTRQNDLSSRLSINSISHCFYQRSSGMQTVGSLQLLSRNQQTDCRPWVINKQDSSVIHHFGCFQMLYFLPQPSKTLRRMKPVPNSSEFTWGLEWCSICRCLLSQPELTPFSRRASK